MAPLWAAAAVLAGLAGTKADACVVDKCLLMNRFDPAKPNLYHSMFADLGIALREALTAGEADRALSQGVPPFRDEWAVRFVDDHGPAEEDAVYDGAGFVVREYDNGQTKRGVKPECEVRCRERTFDMRKLPWGYSPHGRWSLHYEVAAKDPLSAEEAATKLAWVRDIAQRTVRRTLGAGPTDVPTPSQRRSGCVLLFLHREGRRRAVNAASILETVRAHSICSVKAMRLYDQPMHKRIAALRSADVVAGVHGSAFAYVQFFRPETVMLELAPYGWLDAGYRNLAKAVNVQYFVVQVEDAWRVSNPRAFRHADHAFSESDVATVLRAVKLIVANTARRFGAACPEDMTPGGSKAVRWLGGTPMGCNFLWGDKDIFKLRYVPTPPRLVVPKSLADALDGIVWFALAKNQKLAGQREGRPVHIRAAAPVVSSRTLADVLVDPPPLVVVANALDVDDDKLAEFIAAAAHGSTAALVLLLVENRERTAHVLSDTSSESLGHSPLCGSARAELAVLELAGSVATAFSSLIPTEQARVAPLVALAALEQVSKALGDGASLVLAALDPGDLLLQGDVAAALPPAGLSGVVAFEDATTLSSSAKRKNGAGKGVLRVYGRHRLLMGAGSAPPASQAFVGPPRRMAEFARALLYEATARGMSPMGGLAPHMHVLLRYASPRFLATSAGNVRIRPRSPHDPLGASLRPDDGISTTVVNGASQLGAADARQAPALLLSWRSLRGSEEGRKHVAALKAAGLSANTRAPCVSVRL